MVPQDRRKILQVEKSVETAAGSLVKCTSSSFWFRSTGSSAPRGWCKTKSEVLRTATTSTLKTP